MTIIINETGLTEIRDFLRQYHKTGDQMTADMIVAWAADAERHANDGNGASIEIRPWDSWRGRAEILDISPAGFDVEPDD